jgi:hypothetical protein
VHTNAIFIGSVPPEGGHRVSRVKVLNGYGSHFFDREAFLIALGGNDCAIEDCSTEGFRGDYGTLMVVFYGQNSVIRNCTARYDRVPTPYTLFAYGGWALFDTVFEGNYCNGFGSANNIDSLSCRNVMFRNNRFMNCAYSGILVNMNGHRVPSCPGLTMSVNGEVVLIERSKMDGLLVTGNLIEMRDDSINGAVRIQQDGLSNVRISENVLRTVSGEGAIHAIRSFGEVRNIVVTENVCDPNMTFLLHPDASCHGNTDFSGQPLLDE